MHATSIFKVERIRSKLMAQQERMWFVARNVASHMCGNVIRDTAYPLALGMVKWVN
jgi:hypothetical protein